MQVGDSSPASIPRRRGGRVRDRAGLRPTTLCGHRRGGAGGGTGAVRRRRRAGGTGRARTPGGAGSASTPGHGRRSPPPRRRPASSRRCRYRCSPTANPTEGDRRHRHLHSQPGRRRVRGRVGMVGGAGVGDHGGLRDVVRVSAAPERRRRAGTVAAGGEHAGRGGPGGRGAESTSPRHPPSAAFAESL
jgi:hypothetical protein